MSWDTFKQTKAGDPSSESVDYLLGRLEKVFVKDKKLILDMTASIYPPHNERGSRCCVGAAAGIAFGIDHFLGWQTGAHIMAEVLGFTGNIRDSTITKLEFWARDNPDLWGNECGYNMFYNVEAYNYSNHRLSFKDVYNHWGGVKNRLKEMELNNE